MSPRNTTWHRPAPGIAPHLALPRTLSLRGALATKQAPPTPGIASSQGPRNDKVGHIPQDLIRGSGMRQALPPYAVILDASSP